ncbi:MAG: alkane 1-monooxygenase [Gammaproteobacteria bacterium]
MNTATLNPGSDWADHKRYLWLLGAAVMFLPVGGLAFYQATGWAFWLWFPLLFFYGVIPLMDRWLGEDNANPPDAAMPALSADRYYRWALYAAIPAYFGVWAYMAWFASTTPLAWYEWLGLALSTGVGCGVAINLGHELGHQTDPLERFLAKLVLAPGAYGHFFVEHNRGHHVRVATPEDPASARFGESFYAFFPRCVIGSFRSAWELEKQRLARLGKPVWHYQNHNLQTWAMTVLIWAGMAAWLGWAVLPFLLVAAVYGGSLLEVVNYLEHYGLMRARKPDGSYERCQPQHSWNSNHVVTNVLLYHLQRHSDHHANPTRSYQTLRHFDGVPSLPSGYAAMIMIAYVPWLWFRLMDPKVVAHYGGDMRRANIQPALREAVLAKYGAGSA